MPGAVPRPEVRRVIVEPVDARDPRLGVLAMDERGRLRSFDAPADALRWIRRRDADKAKGGSGFVVTQVEWRWFPEGFVPPE